MPSDPIGRASLDCAAVLIAAWLAGSTVGSTAEPVAPQPAPRATRSGHPDYPTEKRVSYRDQTGTHHLYLVQEPDELPSKPCLLIYMHGAGGMEEQGMDPVWASKTFQRLRILMAKRNWVYVCPRDEEFRSLLQHLRETYKPGEIYLSGGSAGGRAAFYEAITHPSPYSGLLLLCPAAAYPHERRINVEKLTMPIWIVAGEKDDLTPFSRELAKDLKRTGKQFIYIEIPGGDHGDPMRKIEWEKALKFLSEPASIR